MTGRLGAIALILFAVGAVTAACSSTSASPAPDAADLPGTAWTVTSIGGVATDATAPPTMTFGADGNVSGTTGCNQYNASYKLDGGAIEVGLLTSTMMLCQGPVGAQETVFVATLPKSTAWSIAEDGSLVLSGSADIVATPAGAS